MYENTLTENKPRTDVEQKSDMLLNVTSLYKRHLGRATTSTVISVRRMLGQTSMSWSSPQKGSKPDRSILQIPFLQAALKHMQWDAQCTEEHRVFEGFTLSKVKPSNTVNGECKLPEATAPTWLSAPLAPHYWLQTMHSLTPACPQLCGPLDTTHQDTVIGCVKQLNVDTTSIRTETFCSSYWTMKNINANIF